MHDHHHHHPRRDLSDLVSRNLFGNVNHAKAQQANSDDAATVVSVVYVTMSATFTGPTAGFVTEGVDGVTSTAKAATLITTKAATTPTTKVQTTSSSSTTNNDSTSSTAAIKASPSSVSKNAQTSSPQTTMATATSSATKSGTAFAVAEASSSATASASATAVPSTGMSTATKAGLGFGVLVGLALIAGIVIVMLRRKRKQQEAERLEDEKPTDAFFGTSEKHPTTTSARAPRVSLRPITQLMSSINEPKLSELTSATGGLASAGNWEKRQSSHVASSPSNPFANNAETVDHAAAADKAAENAPIPVPAAITSNPFADDRAKSPDMARSPPSAPNSPPGSVTGAAAAILGGSTSPKGPSNNVHRVQLDFKPSMEDEIELRAGQVIRVLHEYDDGWALCMRMDRTKQGVAPRTCLSKMPIKPRPLGPPPNRANGHPGQPGMRNFSGPPGGPGPRNPMYPAPLSPSMSSLSSNGSRQYMIPMPPPHRDGRQRSYSQSQPGGPSGMPRPRGTSGASASSAPREHRRSASASQILQAARVPSRKPVPGL